jgi:hypothetical protein
MAKSPDHITCQEVVELVTDYFEGTLPADEAELFEQHVPPDTRERLLAAFTDWKRS